MGNTIPSSCFNINRSASKPNQICLNFWDGTARVLTGAGNHVAGEIMFEFPETMVCHADSFFIGRPVPALSIHDPLLPGNTYFVLPLDSFPCLETLTLSSIATLKSKTNKNPNDNKNTMGEGRPFEYVKGEDGRAMIRVLPEFIMRLIGSVEAEVGGDQGSSSPLCSTPELQKHYNQLVGSNKVQVWSPKPETIREHKLRFSPCRFIGLEWKQYEGS